MAIKPMMLIISLVLVCVWQIPVTHSVGQVTNFATDSHTNSPVALTTSSKPLPVGNAAVMTPVQAAGIAFAIPVIAPILAIKEALFSTSNYNTTQNALMAESNAIGRFGASAGFHVYADATSSGYAISAINDDATAATKLPPWAGAAIGLLERVDKLLLIDLFPVIGIAAMYLAFRRKPAGGTFDFIVIGIGAYLLIVVMVLVPYLQIYYNLTRLYLQMFAILGVLAILGGVAISKYFPKYQTLVLALMVVVAFSSLSGLADQFTGGFTQLTFAQPPTELDIYYTYDTEVAGARWLAANYDTADPVQADIVANLRLQSFGDMNASNLAVFPQTLQQKSYVYLIGENITRGDAFYQYENNLLTYNYPLAFLNEHKNLIYNDSGSRVYR